MELMASIAYTLIGPFLGGLIIGAVGVGWAFAADASTFAVSALMVALIAHRYEEGKESTSPLTDVREGISFVRRTRWFWISLVFTAATILVTQGAWEALIPFVIKEELGASAFALGVVYAAGGVGASSVAILMGQKGRLPRKPLTAYYIAWAISNLCMMGFGLIFEVWQAVLISVVAQAVTATQNVLWFTMEYRLIPNEILGRVSSLDWMIVLVGLPLSYSLVGVVANQIGVRQTLIATGVLGALVMLVPLFIPDALTPERDGSFDKLSEGDDAASAAPA
jgi:hypothetical protein